MAAPKRRSDYARWKAGFEEVNAADRLARRGSTPDEDFATLAGLMQSADEFGWSERLRAGEDEVRLRWLRLWRRAS